MEEYHGPICECFHLDRDITIGCAYKSLTSFYCRIKSFALPKEWNIAFWQVL